MSSILNVLKSNIKSSLTSKCTRQNKILSVGQKRSISVDVGKIINDDITNIFFLPVDSGNIFLTNILSAVSIR